MTRVLLRSTVVALLVLMSPISGRACSCAIEPSATEALASTEEVFSGRVVTMKRPNADAVIQSSMDPVLVTIAVDRVWKGVVGPLVELTTFSDVSCGFNFAENQRYLVFTNERFASICSHTSVLERAAEDLAALGAGHAPDPFAPPRRPRPAATPGEPDATGYEQCPEGVTTITEPFAGFLDLDRLSGTYDMACGDCTITRCNVSPREGPVVTRYADGQMHIRGFYRHGRREGA